MNHIASPAPARARCWRPAAIAAADSAPREPTRWTTHLDRQPAAAVGRRLRAADQRSVPPVEPDRAADRACQRRWPSRARAAVERVRHAAAADRRGTHRTQRGRRSRSLPRSDRVLTFGGKHAVTIPPGAPMLSDPVELDVAALGDVSVSLYLPEPTPPATFHWDARQTAYVGAGDQTGGDRVQSRHDADARACSCRRSRSKRRGHAAAWSRWAIRSPTATGRPSTATAAGPTSWPAPGRPGRRRAQRRHLRRAPAAGQDGQQRAGALRPRRAGAARRGGGRGADRHQRHRLERHAVRADRARPRAPTTSSPATAS